MSQGFHKSTLANGVRVLTEHHPRSRAISVGIFVTRGTRDETSAQAGVSHFVEHMVFKRTESRNAYEIARDMEAVGGDLNAYTSREYTCFVTLALKEHLELSIDVLSDLVCRARFDKDEFEREKQVVIQEIAMSEDLLEEYIFDLYFEKAYGNTSMGHPILGTRDSIGGMSRDDVFDYYKKMYNAENLIVCVAGNASHDEVVALAEKWLKPFKVPRTRISSQRDTKDLRLGHGPSASKRAKALKRFTHIVQKPAEQVHVLMGLPASSFRDKLRFEAYIVNSLLGGGMTSRLYQSIREDRGLAYSVYSMLSTFIDSGTIMVYAATDTKSSRKVVDLMVKELKRLKSRGVSRADLELYKTQVTGQILLGADDLENRMNSLGANEMVFGKYRPIDDVMKEIGTVTQDSVQEYLDKHLDLDRMGLLLMGAVDKESKKWTNEIL